MNTTDITKRQARVDKLTADRDELKRLEDRAKDRGDFGEVRRLRCEKSWVNNALRGAKARLRHLSKK